ncbi:hypothetical protein EGU77_18085 [Pseudomonas syringae pv. theae]|nr:hypothetical protein [Pseudomonas syringae pv. theae]MBL3837104.1 hypothetical protein [Pseudomonas syringae pv. theae]MBL3868497.1 hypothetical protein [Pseudomonas syringae pv. theae]
MVRSRIRKTGRDFESVEGYDLSGFAQPTEYFDVHEANLAGNRVNCMDVQLTACRHHPSTQADQLRKTHAFIEGKQRPDRF